MYRVFLFHVKKTTTTELCWTAIIRRLLAQLIFEWYKLCKRKYTLEFSVKSHESVAFYHINSQSPYRLHLTDVDCRSYVHFMRRNYFIDINIFPIKWIILHTKCIYYCYRQDEMTMIWYICENKNCNCESELIVVAVQICLNCIYRIATSTPSIGFVFIWRKFKLWPTMFLFQSLLLLFSLSNWFFIFRHKSHHCRPYAPWAYFLHSIYFQSNWIIGFHERMRFT